MRGKRVGVQIPPRPRMVLCEGLVETAKCTGVGMTGKTTRCHLALTSARPGHRAVTPPGGSPPGAILSYGRSARVTGLGNKGMILTALGEAVKYFRLFGQPGGTFAVGLRCTGQQIMGRVVGAVDGTRTGE